MKRKALYTVLMIACTFLNVKAQDTIAGWTFPTGTAIDANPNHGIVANAAMTITTQGGTSAIDFTKYGLTTKSAQATGWDGGKDIKYWQIEINTTGYNNLKLNSKQTAGGANPGPRDWKAQYKVGSAGSWFDIPGTALVNANNWTSAVLSNVSLPSACDNQTSVFIRWIMTSDTSIAPPALVVSLGTTKIDDIFILGNLVSVSIEQNEINTFSIFPNPGNGMINIQGDEQVKEIEIYNCTGILIEKIVNRNLSNVFDLTAYPRGIYLIKFLVNNTSEPILKKIIIQ